MEPRTLWHENITETHTREWYGYANEAGYLGRGVSQWCGGRPREQHPSTNGSRGGSNVRIGCATFITNNSKSHYSVVRGRWSMAISAHCGGPLATHHFQNESGGLIVWLPVCCFVCFVFCVEFFALYGLLVYRWNYCQDDMHAKWLGNNEWLIDFWCSWG